MRNYKKFMAFTVAAVLAVQVPGVAWAGNWVDDGDGWHYEQDGQKVTGRWIAGKSNTMYYVGNDGNMAVDTFIMGDQDQISYVDDSGKRVIGWRQLDRKDGEASGEAWYYFNINGDAVTGKKVIDGKKYFFDENGKMLTGWVSWTDRSAEPFTGNLEDKDGDVYYCLDSGETASGWLQIAPPIQEEDDFGGDGTAWYNFDGGKVRTNTKEGLDGKDYIFTKDGKMVTGWAYKDGDNWTAVTEKTDSGDIDRFKTDVTKFYYAKDDGSLAKNQWLKVKCFDKLTGDGDEDTAWYYFDRKGNLTGRQATATPADAMSDQGVYGPEIHTKVYKGNKGKYEVKKGGDIYNEDAPTVTIKKVDNKYYMFNTIGKLADGLIYLPKTLGRFQQGYYNYDDKSALKPGAAVLKDDGRDYYYYFANKNDSGYSLGQGVTGIVNGRLYYEGLAVMAEEGTGWQPAYIEPRDNRSISGLYLVDETGKVKGGGIVTNEEGTQFKLEKKKGVNSKQKGYDIYYRDGSNGYHGNDGYVKISEDDETLVPLRPDSSFHYSEADKTYYPDGVSEGN